jgi:hypothetical protein
MNAAEFRIGRVLRQAVVAWWPNLVPWLALAAIVQSPVIFYLLSGLDYQRPPHWAFTVLFGAVTTAFSVIAQAAVTSAMLMQLGGRRLTLAESASAVLHLPASLIRFAVGYGLAVGLVGLVVLVDLPTISGLIHLVFLVVVFLYYSVTVPVLISEQTNVIDALRRSNFLTQNHRPRLLGIYLLLGVGYWLVIFVVVRVASMEQRPLIFQMISMSIGSSCLAVVSTASYRALRLAKEGINIQKTHDIPAARIHAD